VIRGHRYRPEHGAAGHDSDYDDDDSEDDMDDAQKVHSVWQRSRHQSKQGESTNSDEILQHDFLRKYLHFAKTRMRPELTEGARDFIANRYAEMRCRQDERTLPVTPRTLETVIRLASAHAKARLSNVVEAEPDCEIAMDILSFALYHENISGIKNKVEETEQEAPVPAVSDEGESGESDSEGPAIKKQRLDDTEESQSLKSRLWEQVKANGGQATMKDLCTEANRDEVTKAVESLEDEGKLLTTEEGSVYLVD
jgi:DNA replication licensing factor MCM3